MAAVSSSARRQALGGLLAAAALTGCGQVDGVRQQAASPVPQPQATSAGQLAAEATGAPRAPTQGQGSATPTPAPTKPPAASAATPVELAQSPRALAEVLVAAERAVRDEQVAGDDLAAAAHTQQRAYRRLSLKPGWRDDVVRLVPRDIRSAVRNNVRAGAALTSLVTPQRELPDWRIVRPAPAVDLLAYYRQAAAEFGMDWPYLAAIHLVETRMGRIRGRSTAGARGPMQFMPATWDAYGRGDINDNADAIMAAARYLAANGAPAHMARALWHYNHSDRYVEAVSAYADVMRADERTFRGYYHWQVHYMTRDGDVHLPEGYGTKTG